METEFFDGNGKKYTLDINGFLEESSEWTRGFAEAMAKFCHRELGEGQYKIIHWIRKFRQEEGKMPRIAQLIAGTGLGIKEIYELFPAGLSEACRIGGLTRPGCG